MSRLSLLVVLAVFITGCEYYAPIKKKPMPALNKTSYEFPYTIDVVRQAIYEGFASYAPRHEAPYTIGLVSANGLPVRFSFEAKSSDSAESTDSYSNHAERETPNDTDFSSRIKSQMKLHAAIQTRDSLHSTDFYLNRRLWTNSVSPAYTVRGKPIAIEAAFTIHLEPTSDSSTTVSVTANRSEYTRGMLQLGEGCLFLKTDTLASTTVEEYMILRYLGGILHVPDMPPVVLPEK